MFLAHFPVEVLCLLTEYVTLTDLILLHACGDGLLNSKLKTSPITINAKTPRCCIYYNLPSVHRFENVIRVVCKMQNLEQNFSHIPPTAKYVTTNFFVCCMIPASVEKLVAHCISEGVRFERAAGELEVHVDTLLYGWSNLEYITHLGDYSVYTPEMVNLKAIYLPVHNVQPPIPGVKFEYRVPKCWHRMFSTVADADSMWALRNCSGCGVTYSAISKDGKVCPPISPCKLVMVCSQHFKDVRQYIAAVPTNATKLRINGTVAQMNEFSNSGGFDLIPSTIKKVKIFLVMKGEVVNFIGVKKNYHFTINVRCESGPNKRRIEIEDMTGIEELHHRMFDNSEEKATMLQRHPRLSIMK